MISSKYFQNSLLICLYSVAFCAQADTCPSPEKISRYLEHNPQTEKQSTFLGWKTDSILPHSMEFVLAIYVLPPKNQVDCQYTSLTGRPRMTHGIKKELEYPIKLTGASWKPISPFFSCLLDEPSKCKATFKGESISCSKPIESEEIGYVRLDVRPNTVTLSCLYQKLILTTPGIVSYFKSHKLSVDKHYVPDERIWQLSGSSYCESKKRGSVKNCTFTKLVRHSVCKFKEVAA